MIAERITDILSHYTWGSCRCRQGKLLNARGVHSEKGLEYPEFREKKRDAADSLYLWVTMTARKIIHVDMDAFYASVEQRDDPVLRGKPVAVGSPRARGVVAAASYEARRFGVHSAMPSVTALRKCPELVFVPPRFEVYRAVSQQVRAIFATYTDLVEPLSLDEAYLDVTENLPGLASATAIAERIRADIERETALTASAGISYNKFLAKMASGQRKPNGQFVITPKMGAAFVEALPVGKFHGIGPSTDAKMERLGLRVGADLCGCTLAFLQKHFGSRGAYYYWIARGVDERPVQPDRERKSIGAENTFLVDLTTYDEAFRALAPLIEKVWRRTQGLQAHARTLTLKVKFANFDQITRARTLPQGIQSQPHMELACGDLLTGVFPLSQGIRLLGVTLSALGEESRQLSLHFPE